MPKARWAKMAAALWAAGLILGLILGLAPLAQAGWFLPITGFHHTIDRALLQEKAQDDAKAKESWRKVLEYGEKLLADSPESVTYLFGTARACYALGDYRRAASLWEAVLEQGRKKGVSKLPDTYPWVYVYLGLAYARLGDTAKAVEHWKKVPVSIGPVYASIQEQLATLGALPK